MKTIIYSLTILAISVMFSGCKKNPDEGDRNSFTWKGRVVKDCSDQPIANATVYLELEYGFDPNTNYEAVAEATTDADGYFSLTYKRITKLNASTVRFYFQTATGQNAFIMTSPVNRSVNRDISIKNCHQHHFVIENKGSADSIYLLIGKPIDDTPFFWTSVPGLDSSSKYAVIATHINDLIDLNVIKVESFTSSTWNNTGVKNHFTVAKTYKDMVKAMQANLIDSIDFPGHKFEYEIRGYPYIDTISLEL